MLQTLLEDRFKLKIHRETTEGPVYALTPANEPRRLKPFKEGSCIQMPLTLPAPTPPPGQRYCKTLISLLGPSVVAEGSTLTEFSKLLNLVLDRLRYRTARTETDTGPRARRILGHRSHREAVRKLMASETSIQTISQE